MREVAGPELFKEPQLVSEAVVAGADGEAVEEDHGLFIDPADGLSDPFFFKFKSREEE